jgi:hypothetical protein
MFDVYPVAFEQLLNDAAVALTAPIRHASLLLFGHLFLLLFVPLVLPQRLLFALLSFLVAFLINNFF